MWYGSTPHEGELIRARTSLYMQTCNVALLPRSTNHTSAPASSMLMPYVCIQAAGGTSQLEPVLLGNADIIGIEACANTSPG